MKWITVCSICVAAMLGCASPLRDIDPARANADMQALAGPSEHIVADMLAYIQAGAHGSNPAAVEAKRAALIGSVENAILRANQVNPYNGDQRYKNAVLDFYNTLYAVLRRDYANLVNLEEIREQSYDDMEAYLSARAKANEKLDEASARLRQQEALFAADYRITLIEAQSENSRKLQIASQVLDYHSKIFLLNFRSYKQEGHLMDALNRADVSSLEQNRETLLDYAEQGLTELSSFGPYNADTSLLAASRNNLEFYRDEAARDMPTILDYLLKKDQFDEARRSMDLMPPASRTQQSVDSFNRLVGEMNALGARYNQVNQRLNQRRGQLVNQWNQVNEGFLHRHVPR
ncbi:MAG: hypothetical protein K1X75_15680 [Leptospirales bacterium]|nr:hypothetical protein [Leptospirales bacterium]